MSNDINIFFGLLKIHFTKRNIARISMRTKFQSNSPFWYLYRRSIITGTIARRIITQNRKGLNNDKFNR